VAPTNGFGRVGAYFVLFSEIGLVLLVTIMVGVLGGYWLDQQIGTLPVFALAGFFLGLAAGARAVWQLISRFLESYED
jgi:F0F1-type ATP synthase assembly protein I